MITKHIFVTGYFLPEQLLFSFQVMRTESFQLGLSLLEFGQYLVFQVSPGALSLVRIEETLSYQLLLNPSLQRACVWNTGIDRYDRQTDYIDW